MGHDSLSSERYCEASSALGGYEKQTALERVGYLSRKTLHSNARYVCHTLPTTTPLCYHVPGPLSKSLVSRTKKALHTSTPTTSTGHQAHHTYGLGASSSQSNGYQGVAQRTRSIHVAAAALTIAVVADHAGLAPTAPEGLHTH